MHKHVRRKTLAIGAAVVCLVLTHASVASAVPDDGVSCTAVTCEARATSKTSTATQSEKKPISLRRSDRVQGVESGGTPTGKSASLDPVSPYDLAVHAYRAALSAQRACLNTNVPLTVAGDASSFCGAPTRPELPDSEPTAPAEGGQARGSASPAVPAITPEQAAYVAVAQLQLPTISPGIGPSPEMNEWDMAVVGYPLWLWADGPTHVGPVSQTVAGLSVSLEARVARVDFRMGDGSVVRCSGPGTAWSKAGAGKKSPTCGHTYEDPSLPKGSYTVVATAWWDVAWTVNGASGVITITMSSSTDLPVGELQVLVTR
jgi:hypothetical protein